MIVPQLSILALIPSLVSCIRICDPGGTAPFYSGFRIDWQVSTDDVFPTSYDTHLVLCKDGNPMSDISYKLTAGSPAIPWNETLCDSFNTNCFKLARAKKYSLRDVALFFPGSEVGGLFELKIPGEEGDDKSYIPVSSLISDSVLNQWMELKKGSNSKVYHIPLLYTPDIDSRKYSKEQSLWFRTISASENYDFDEDTRTLFKKSFDVLLSRVTETVKLSYKNIIKLNEIVSDRKPDKIKVASLKKQVSKNLSVFLNIFKAKIDELAKSRINKNLIDFETLVVLSKALTTERFFHLMSILNESFSGVPVEEQIFVYPSLSTASH